MPLLSIIVPVYKVECFLNRCVDSILNQEYTDFELILVNDGSPDYSGNICDAYALRDNRVKVIHKKNGGLSSARNAGLEIAVGSYVGFVDSDDWITSDMYSFLIDKALKYNADIVASSYKLTNGDSKIKKEKEFTNCFTGEKKLIVYLEQGMKSRVADYSVCNKVYRKLLFENIEFPEGQLYEDGVTNFKLIKKANKFVRSNKVTYFYFQDSDSITRKGFSKQDYDILLVGQQFVDLARKQKSDKLLDLAKMKEARAYFSMLAKISVYGFQSETKNKTEIVKDLTKNLRKKYCLLLRSPMPLNRKVLMTLLCIDIRFVELPVKILTYSHIFKEQKNAKKSK